MQLVFSLTCCLSLAFGATIVKHKSYPNHKMSVNNPVALGIDTVKQYSGYLDTGAGNNMFYWVFESRSDPVHDPTILWLNGGPGCSSLQAVLFENGPSTLDDNMKPVHNPYSWNNKANVIYLDQPIGVGFSSGSEVVSTTLQAAVDVEAFLTLFFKKFPHLHRENDFHISGESYGGRYIPTFAERIMSNRHRTTNVTSVLIGNGLVDPVAQYQAYEPMLCGQGGYPQKISSYQCTMMRASLPACVSALNSCITGGNQHARSCGLAQITCQAQEGPWQGLNPYDIRDATCAPADDGLCYPQLDRVGKYFNQASVKRAIGADENINYLTCTDDINSRFTSNHDSFTHTQSNVTSLLEQGVKVLVFSGDKDIICNWLGGRQWTSRLPWSGQSQFSQAISSMNPWEVSGKPAGQVANYGPLTFLRVYDAGHMVPHDQPKSAYAMVQAWLDKDLAFKKDLKIK